MKTANKTKRKPRARKEEPSRSLINKLKQTFTTSGDPQLEALAPHVAGGVRILNYMFASLEAAQQVAAPKGIVISHLEVRVKDPSNAEAVGRMTTACWMLDRVKEALGHVEKV